MYNKKNLKFMAALISASVVVSSLSLPAFAAENETGETEVILSTETSAENVILTSSGDNTITFSGSGISAEGSGISISESDGITTAEIEADGEYSLSGEASGVSVTVKKGTTATLDLSDLSIDNSGNDELIFFDIGKGSEINIVLNGDAAIKGGENAIKGKGSVINISGEGSLSIEGTADDGIKAKEGTVSISGGTIDITECGGDGIQA